MPPPTYYNRTVYLGTTVKFPCPRKLKKSVIWRHYATLPSERRPSFPTNLYSHGRMHDSADPRMSVDQNNSYALVIANVSRESTEYYGCYEHDGFGNAHFFVLTVVGELHCFISMSVI